jgi:hypothetical protein
MEGMMKQVHYNEDWFAVLLAFVLILLAAVGILGKNGIPISF